MYRLLNDFYHHYHQYFGLRGDLFKRNLSAAFILGMNILMAYCLTLINASFHAFFGLLETEGLTYTALFGGVGQLMGCILIYAALASINLSISSWLGQSLQQAKNKDLTQKWLKFKSYFGIKFVNKKNKQANELSPPQIMSQDNKELAADGVALFNTFIKTCCNFVVGFIGLWALSCPLSFTVLGTTLVIPGYMVICSIAYSLAYNTLTSFFRTHIMKNEVTHRKFEKEFFEKCQSVHTNAEQVAFKHGELFEQERINNMIDNFTKNARVRLFYSSVVLFINTIHQELNFAIGMILSAPEIISKRINSAQLFDASSYFSFIVTFFTFKSDNIEKLSSLEVSAKRMNDFNHLIEQWNELNLHSQKQLPIKNHTKAQLKVDALKITTPDGRPIVLNFSARFNSKSITLIQGPSGVGKSTLFRAIAGLWPYAQGLITLPNETKVESIYFIPQKSYFPYGTSLIDAICYPKRPCDFSNKQLDDIKKLMRQMDIKETIIKDCENTDDWNATLSGGEQQRISLISAILHQPKILFMDESTSAIDKDKKTKIEQIIKQNLPDSIIAYIDHNPSQNSDTIFHNKTLLLKASSGMGVESQTQIMPLNKCNLALSKKKRRSPDEIVIQEGNAYLQRCRVS